MTTWQHSGHNIETPHSSDDPLGANMRQGGMLLTGPTFVTAPSCLQSCCHHHLHLYPWPWVSSLPAADMSNLAM